MTGNPQAGPKPGADECWEFDVDGHHGRGWIWRRVDFRGGLLDRSRAFGSCLSAVRDARTHGFAGRPRIVSPVPRPLERRR